MRIKSNIDFTYMGNLDKIYYANDVTDDENIHQLLLQFRQASLLNLILPQAPILFAIDYTKRQYIFFSSSLGRYSAKQILEGGLEMTIPLMPKEFFKTFNEDVFPSTLSLLKTVDQNQHDNYIVSFNHRIKNKNGKNIDTYQRCKYITSKQTGLPTHCLGVGFDISNLNKRNSISLSFEKTDRKTGYTGIVATKHFYPNEEDSLLSPPEKNILKYMSEGLTSKEIANKLTLSVKTIENHRTNMLRKTNTKNVVELVASALKNNII